MATTHTFKAFAATLAKWQAQVPEKANLMVQGIATTLLDEMQNGGKYSPGTPIKTGFARSCWQGGLGSIPQNQPAASPDAAHSLALEVLVTAKAGDVVYLANVCPYIGPLEYGHSKQAPTGFVRLALAALPRIVDEVGQFVVARYAQ